MLLWYVITGILIIPVGAVLFRRRLAQRTAIASGIEPDDPHGDTVKVAHGSRAEAIPFRTDATAAAQDSIYKLAFGVARVNYNILGDHRRVLAAIEEAIGSVAGQARYFPRK